MTDLDFRCTGVRPEPFGASPTLLFGLRIEELDHQPVHALALRCQLRIEPAKRGYDPDEVDMLGDLFGEPSRWNSTLRPLQFAHASLTVPAFTGTTHVDLPVPCTYDTEVASASYFRALARGEIPLLMLFSGTVFTGRGGFRAEPIPWHKEASCLMPVDVWRELIESYFPNTGWLRLRKDCLEALRHYRSERALPSWERVFEELLAAAEAKRAEQGEEATKGVE